MGQGTFGETQITSQDERKRARNEKRFLEKDRLLGKLHSNNLKDVKTRVAYILNHYPETRNSDVTLALRYWEVFDKEQVGDLSVIKPTDLYRIERMPSLTRARAKIQNEYGLFLADEKVRHRRRNREEQEKEAQLADVPPMPVSDTFADESGKTQRFFGVGGAWINSVHRSAQVNIQLSKWSREHYRGGEFHFSNLSRNDVEPAKEFFRQAISLADVWGFKAIIVDNTQVKSSVDEMTADMYAFYVLRGIDHEISHDRLALPRHINVWKDKEDGLDPVLLEKIRNYVSGVVKERFDNKVKLSSLEAVDSKASSLVQISDLFLGSVLRICNRGPEANRNHKDDFAEYVCGALGLDFKKLDQPVETDAVCIWFL